MWARASAINGNSLAPIPTMHKVLILAFIVHWQGSRQAVELSVNWFDPCSFIPSLNAGSEELKWSLRQLVYSPNELWYLLRHDANRECGRCAPPLSPRGKGGLCAADFGVVARLARGFCFTKLLRLGSCP